MNLHFPSVCLPEVAAQNFTEPSEWLGKKTSYTTQLNLKELKEEGDKSWQTTNKPLQLKLQKGLCLPSNYELTNGILRWFTENSSNDWPRLKKKKGNTVVTKRSFICWYWCLRNMVRRGWNREKSYKVMSRWNKHQLKQTSVVLGTQNIPKSNCLLL